MKEINENELKEVNGGYDLSSLPPEMTERQDNVTTVECIKSCNTITDFELKNQCTQKCLNDFNNKTDHNNPYTQGAIAASNKLIDTLNSLR